MNSRHAVRRQWRMASRHWLMAPLSLALAAPAAQGAAFLPRSDAAPPTGELTQAAPTPVEPLAGSGIQWTLAPWRMGGSVALDLRALRLEDGRTTRQSLLIGDLDMASYVWQPWFVQLRLGLGFVGAQSSGDTQNQGQLGSTLTGRAAITVFPASRFPFELRADVSDSRSGGVGLGGDYSSRRLALSQSWRPVSGNLQLQLLADYSDISDGLARDTLSTFTATALRHSGAHTVDLGLTHSDNHRSDSDEHTRLSSATARHTFNPAGELNIESFASWNEARVQGGGFNLDSDVRQLSSFASWRAKRALWAGADAPLVVASARWVQARSPGSDNGAAPQAFNATLGASQALSPAWRASASASFSRLQSGTRADGDSAGAQGSLSWSPAGSLWAGWRYTPSASINGSYFNDVSAVVRKTAGVQASHGVSRDWPLGETSSLSFGLTQSGAVLKENQAAELTRALAHGASLSWQALSSEGSQSYGGLSYTDSRTLGSTQGRFELVNLQLSQRTQLSRFSNWSINLTLQGSNNRSSDIDAFSGQRRDVAMGWQRFYAGTLSYEHQRAFGVPRLRHAVLLGVNSQPLERRALGDIDAPRERITESLETRLDYTVGRLDTRMSLRAARVDGRLVVALQARAQRRF
jgi:hypothetical protein